MNIVTTEQTKLTSMNKNITFKIETDDIRTKLLHRIAELVWLGEWIGIR